MDGGWVLFKSQQHLGLTQLSSVQANAHNVLPDIHSHMGTFEHPINRKYKN